MGRVCGSCKPICQHDQRCVFTDPGQNAVPGAQSRILGQRASVLSLISIHERCHVDCGGDVNVAGVHGRDGGMIIQGA
jgi:hypothetical protein